MRSEIAATPAQHPPPTLEPVPVEGCRICTAAANGRKSAWNLGSERGARRFSDIISQHPHRRATDARGRV